MTALLHENILTRLGYSDGRTKNGRGPENVSTLCG